MVIYKTADILCHNLDKDCSFHRILFFTFCIFFKWINDVCFHELTCFIIQRGLLTILLKQRVFFYWNCSLPFTRWWPSPSKAWWTSLGWQKQSRWHSKVEDIELYSFHRWTRPYNLDDIVIRWIYYQKPLYLIVLTTQEYLR